MIDIDFFEDVRRDEALRAVEFNLADMIFELEHRERSFIARNGGGLDPKSAVQIRTLRAARALVAEFYAGSRGVAIEVVAANKKAGVERHWMPHWINRPIDALISAFLRPIFEAKAAVRRAEQEAKLVDVAGTEARSDDGVALDLVG